MEKRQHAIFGTTFFVLCILMWIALLVVHYTVEPEIAFWIICALLILWAGGFLYLLYSGVKRNNSLAKPDWVRYLFAVFVFGVFFAWCGIRYYQILRDEVAWERTIQRAYQEWREQLDQKKQLVMHQNWPEKGQKLHKRKLWSHIGEDIDCNLQIIRPNTFIGLFTVGSFASFGSIRVYENGTAHVEVRIMASAWTPGIFADQEWTAHQEGTVQLSSDSNGEDSIVEGDIDGNSSDGPVYAAVGLRNSRTDEVITIAASIAAADTRTVGKRVLSAATTFEFKKQPTIKP